MTAASLDALFRNWLTSREAEHRPDQGNDEEAKEAAIERVSDEMIALERAILAGAAETDDDRRAQVAMLAYYAVVTAPYANYEVLEQWYRRLVTDQQSDPTIREREREWSRKRVERATEHLSEGGRARP
jgi:hypothetical protein